MARLIGRLAQMGLVQYGTVPCDMASNTGPLMLHVHSHWFLHDGAHPAAVNSTFST